MVFRDLVMAKWHRKLITKIRKVNLVMRKQPKKRITKLGKVNLVMRPIREYRRRSALRAPAHHIAVPSHASPQCV